MHRTCGWCGTVVAGERTNCSNCGGPLPAPPGSDPGPAPGAAPRALPSAYTRGLFANFGVLFGSIFSGVGCLVITLMCGFAILLPPLALGSLLGLLFAFIGSVFLFEGVRSAFRERRVLMWGEPVVGTVLSVAGEGSFSRITWSFEVDGATHAGTCQCSDPYVLTYGEGDTLHVVWLPKEGRSAVWPPLPGLEA